MRSCAAREFMRERGERGGERLRSQEDERPLTHRIPPNPLLRYVINTTNYKFGGVSICRVPKKELSSDQQGSEIQDPNTGCQGESRSQETALREPHCNDQAATTGEAHSPPPPPPLL